MFDTKDGVGLFGLIATIGAVIGIGQLLASEEKITIRIAIGRALSSAGLAVSAGFILAFIPNLPVIAICGLAAALASLGTSALEKVFNKYFGN